MISKMMLGSIQRELDDFFQELFGRRVSRQEVTDAAFCKARKKFKHSAFQDLNQVAVDHTYAESSCIERLNGYRVSAIDGSKLRLPEAPSIREYFGPPDKKVGEDGPPMALVSQCYDVLNGIILDSAILPCRVGEREAARQHLRFLGEDDLVLTDRGYAGFCFFQGILAPGADFCCRAPVSWCNAVREFVASGREQAIITLTPTADAKAECAELGLPVEPLELRAVRVELSSGESEVLLTSLRLEDLSVNFFTELYHLRWGCEEGYKHQKLPAEMENFSGKSVEAVKQDFYARVFIVNLTAMLALPMHEEIKQRTANRELDYEINWTTALSKVRSCGLQLFLGEDIEELITQLQEAMAEAVSPHRPGRSFERRKKKSKGRFCMNFKRI